MRALAREGGNWIDRPEEYGVTVDKAGRVAELEYCETLLVVQARLVYADVVVEGENLMKMK